MFCYHFYPELSGVMLKIAPFLVWCKLLMPCENRRCLVTATGEQYLTVNANLTVLFFRAIFLSTGIHCTGSNQLECFEIAKQGPVATTTISRKFVKCEIFCIVSVPAKGFFNAWESIWVLVLVLAIFQMALIYKYLMWNSIRCDWNFSSIGIETEVSVNKRKNKMRFA